MGIPENAAASQKNGPSKSLLKRIDIGLTTAVCAVFISLIALVVSVKEISIAERVGKAEVLPIIDIDFGYVPKSDEKGHRKQYFEVALSNVGAGIAHIQTVSVSQKGKEITNYNAFEESIMTGRMRSWSTLIEKPSAGYLRAGEAVYPVSYRLGGAEKDLSAYLRGVWGTPLDKVNVHVCYCSVFQDCWTVNYLDRKVPQSVASCGIDDEVKDVFQDFIDQRVEERQKG